MFCEIALRDLRSGSILPISTNYALDNSDIFPAPGEGRRCWRRWRVSHSLWPVSKLGFCGAWVGWPPSPVDARFPITALALKRPSRKAVTFSWWYCLRSRSSFNFSQSSLHSLVYSFNFSDWNQANLTFQISGNLPLMDGVVNIEDKLGQAAESAKVLSRSWESFAIDEEIVVLFCIQVRHPIFQEAIKKLHKLSPFPY